jgi:hypothetical protein
MSSRWFDACCELIKDEYGNPTVAKPGGINPTFFKLYTAIKMKIFIISDQTEIHVSCNLIRCHITPMQVFALPSSIKEKHNKIEKIIRNV